MTGRVAGERYILRLEVPRIMPTTFAELLIAVRIKDKIEREASMNKYHFTLVVSETTELTESLADALYSAGCDDATPGTCEGILTLDFHREAASLEDAISTAITNVRRSGLEVARVEIDAAAVEPTL